MKTSPLLIGLVVPLLLAASKKDALPWKEFTSKEGRFSVRLPGTPREQKKAIQTKAGTVERILYEVAVEGKQIYGAGYADFPEAPVKNSSPDALLDGAVKSLKGKLLSEKKITLGKHPGREFQVRRPDNSIYRARIFLVGNRLYQVVVKGPKDVATSAEADRFLDSFKVLGK